MERRTTSQTSDIDNCIRLGFGQSNKLVIIIMIVITLYIHQLLSFCTIQGSKNICKVTNTKPTWISKETQKEQKGKQGYSANLNYKKMLKWSDGCSFQNILRLEYYTNIFIYLWHWLCQLKVSSFFTSFIMSCSYV